MARPTTYKKSYCKLVKELAKDGVSKLEIAEHIGVDRTTLNRWTKRYPEFRDAMAHACEISQAYWERYIRRAAMGLEEGANTKLLELYMRNRFDDWNTAVKQERTVNETITIDHVASIRDRIKTLSGRIEKDVIDVEELPAPSGGENGAASGKGLRAIGTSGEVDGTDGD